MEGLLKWYQQIMPYYAACITLNHTLLTTYQF